LRPDRTTARITGRRLYAVGFVASAAVVLSLTACASGDAAPATPEQTDAATATRELRAAASAPSPAAVASTPSASPTPQPTAAPTVAPPPPAPAAAVPPTATATPYVAVPPPPAPPAAPPPPADLPAPGALEGIRIWSDGDSTSYFMSAALLDMAAGLGAVPVQSAPDYKVSSGLMNPALFDWPAYISSQFDALQPAVAVFMIGANDASSSLPYDVYHQRVGALMDLMRAPFRRVIWVGQPHMGRPDLEPVIPDINQIFQQEAAARPWVTYVDIYGITSAADGSYSAYLPDENGVVQLMRASDGVHFTSAGGRLLASRVLQAILTGR
jgi:hypothetical protein